MTHQWDEFSKSLAEQSVSRRESLRRLGAALAGAFLSPLGLGTAWGAVTNPCKSFCRCSNKTQQNQCLTACGACNGNTSRLCGACGSYACTDLLNDPYNCGACGNACYQAGPYEYGSCLNGACVYNCVAGAVDCGGTCTPVLSDANNCGGCGIVCGSGMSCQSGTCVAVAACQPNCPTNWCGGDGCGGQCGCDAASYCDANYCVPGCDPNSPYPC